MKRGKDKRTRKEYRTWSKEEKYEIVQIIMSGEVSAQDLAIAKGMSSNGLFINWVRKYKLGGIEALENKRKPGNPLTKFSMRKKLTPLEQLQYENMMLKIENERLKKGYTSEEVMALKAKRKSKGNIT